ncbi:MAG: hypothetical protein U9N40_02265 [Euryarchaeota archaeon]|nr:hypothetical protein [Euryarchaeota archaeon]
MKNYRKCALLGIFLIFGLIICSVSPVSALKAEATADQLKIMNEIEGTDITIGEYLQKAWPQFYEELTDEQKEKVNKWKKSWPKPSSGNSVSENENTRASMSTNAYISSGTNRIYYSGDSTVYGGTPGYHYIEVKLKNSADQTVSSTAYSNSESYIEASNIKMYPSSGYYTSNAWSYSLGPDTEDSDSAGPMYYS